MSVEIFSTEDYKKVEKLGLLPTDRDPSGWLRMVARVFAAYKEVDLDQTIVSYISGFWILNKSELSDGNYWKFVIQKGTAFIDDQFIGFIDDLVVRFPKNKFFPGQRYWLVLYYKWSYEFNYNLGEIKAIAPEEWDPNHMLRIASFSILPDGNIDLDPQDLDDQYASNFKKLFQIASDKLLDSLDLVKFQYEAYGADEMMMDPTCKSGDFVFLDYITGKYLPARACTKRFDKSIGIYLKDGSNNKDYIIISGIIDFSEPRWKIDPERNYLTNLEPGTSYYLMDACLEDEVDPDYKDRGKIAPYFYPGTVRVGYSLGRTKFFVRMDYTSELNMQNFIEVFGDSERFMQKYQDFYAYFTKQAELKYIIENQTGLSEYFTGLDQLKSGLNDEITQSDARLASNKASYDNQVQATIFDNATDFNNKNLAYTKYNNQYYDRARDILSVTFTTSLNDLLNTGVTKLTEWEDDISDQSVDFTTEEFNTLNSQIANLTNDIAKIKRLYQDTIVCVQGGQLQEVGTTVLNSIQTILDNYYNGDITADGLKTALYNLISEDPQGTLVRITKECTDIISQSRSYIYSFEFASKHKDLYYKNSDISIVLDSTIYTKYTTLSTTPYGEGNCVAVPTTSVQTISTIQKTGDDLTKYPIDDYPDRTFNILKDYVYAVEAAKNLISVTRLLRSRIDTLYSQVDAIEIMRTTRDTSPEISTINSNFDTYFANTDSITDFKKALDNEQVHNSALKYERDSIDDFSKEYNDIISQMDLDKATISNEINTLANLLGEQLDQETPIRSIFTLNNFQRIIYNYSYLAQRIKIKFNDLITVNNSIQIIENQIEVVINTPPINQALLTDLEKLRDAYNAVKSEIEYELTTMQEEFNKIRTESLGEPAIEINFNDPQDFDPGPYAVTDLDCLITSE